MTERADLIEGRYYWVMQFPRPDGDWDASKEPALFCGISESGARTWKLIGHEDVAAWHIHRIGGEVGNDHAVAKDEIVAALGQLTRLDLEADYEGDHWMTEQKNGEFVRFDDVRAMLEGMTDLQRRAG